MRSLIRQVAWERIGALALCAAVWAGIGVAAAHAQAVQYRAADTLNNIPVSQATPLPVQSYGAFSNAGDGQATTSTSQAAVTYNYLFNGTTWDRWYGTIAGGARVQSGLAVASTDASGSVATASTFQTLQAANSARKGCTVQNTSANVETLKVNTTNLTLAAGQTFSCAQGLLVNGDQLQITSATAGSTYSALFE